MRVVYQHPGGVREACHHTTLKRYMDLSRPVFQPANLFQNPCGNGIDIVEMFQVAETFEIGVRGHNPGGLVFQRSGYVRRVERVVAEFPGQVEGLMQDPHAHRTVLHDGTSVQEVSEGLLALSGVTVPMARHYPVSPHRHNIQYKRDKVAAQTSFHLPGDKRVSGMILDEEYC